METKGYTLATTTINAFEPILQRLQIQKTRKKPSLNQNTAQKTNHPKNGTHISPKRRTHIHRTRKTRPTHQIKRHHDRRNHPNQRLQPSHKKHRTLPKNQRLKPHTDPLKHTSNQLHSCSHSQSISLTKLISDYSFKYRQRITLPCSPLKQIHVNTSELQNRLHITLILQSPLP